MLTHITIDEADEYVHENVHMEFIEEHRWYNLYEVIFEHDGQLYAFSYMAPSTEDQEGGEVYEQDPVPVWQVEAKEVTVITYVKVE